MAKAKLKQKIRFIVHEMYGVDPNPKTLEFIAREIMLEIKHGIEAWREWGFRYRCMVLGNGKNLEHFGGTSRPLPKRD